MFQISQFHYIVDEEDTTHGTWVPFYFCTYNVYVVSSQQFMLRNTLILLNTTRGLETPLSKIKGV